MVIQVAAKSDLGLVRENNEDSFFADSSIGLFVICDGMGGHVAGEVASQKAIEFAVNFLKTAVTVEEMPQRRDLDFRDTWNEVVIDAVAHACNELIHYASLSAELDGMGTTMTLLLIVEDVAFVGHIGDSRLYLKHFEVAKQLTHDHTLFEEFIRENPNWINLNSDIEAIRGFEHVLTRCLGRQADVEIDTFNFQLAEDDVLLLCTDGLSRYFSDEREIVSFLDVDDADTCVENLIAFANKSGGRDNVTAIVIRVVDLVENDFDNLILLSGPVQPAIQPRNESETAEWLPSELNT